MINIILLLYDSILLILKETMIILYSKNDFERRLVHTGDSYSIKINDVLITRLHRREKKNEKKLIKLNSKCQKSTALSTNRYFNENIRIKSYRVTLLYRSKMYDISLISVPMDFDIFKSL